MNRRIRLLILLLPVLASSCDSAIPPTPALFVTSGSSSSGTTCTATPTSLHTKATPAATSFSDLSPTPTLTLTPAPAPSATLPPITMPEFKMAYVKNYRNNDGILTQSQLWILDASSATPRLLVDTAGAQMLIGGGFAWSPDGTQIAYFRLLERETYAVFVLNVATGETRQLTLRLLYKNPSGPGTSADPDLLSWSADGQWLFARVTIHWPDKTLTGDDFLLNTQTGERLDPGEQGRFVAWLHTQPDQYLHTYLDPTTMKETLLLGRPGESEPLRSWPFSSRLVRPYLSPDDSALIQERNRQIAPFDPHDGLFLFDLSGGKLREYDLPGPDHPYHFVVPWSPDGRWIAVWFVGDADITLVSTSDLAGPPWQTAVGGRTLPVRVVPESRDYIPVEWIGRERSLLLLHKEYMLYAVDPERVEDIFPVLDLTTLGVEDPYFRYEVWSP